MLSLKLYQAAEIAVANGSTLTRFYFQDQPQLRNAQIDAIEIYTPGTISATPLSGSTPVTLTDLKKCTLVLYSGDLQQTWSIPLLSLNRINNGTDPYVFELPKFEGVVISWVKSYINASAALATTNVAFAFGIYYKQPQ